MSLPATPQPRNTTDPLPANNLATARKELAKLPLLYGVLNTHCAKTTVDSMGVDLFNLGWRLRDTRLCSGSLVLTHQVTGQLLHRIVNLSRRKSRSDRPRQAIQSAKDWIYARGINVPASSRGVDLFCACRAGVTGRVVVLDLL